MCIRDRYIAGAGEYDLSGDGKVDVIFYNQGTPKPNAGVGVQVYALGKDILLSNNDHGLSLIHI